MHVGDIRSGLKRGREERRRLLTTGERVFAWSYTVLTSLLIPAGVVLLLSGSGATHDVGIALLVIGLLTMASRSRLSCEQECAGVKLRPVGGNSVCHAQVRALEGVVEASDVRPFYRILCLEHMPAGALDPPKPPTASKLPSIHLGDERYER